jgi:hypothetical protein
VSGEVAGATSYESPIGENGSVHWMKRETCDPLAQQPAIKKADGGLTDAEIARLQ